MDCHLGRGLAQLRETTNREPRPVRSAAGRVTKPGLSARNDGRDYFSDKLDVSSRNRKADGKCCKTSGENTVNGCASAGHQGCAGKW
jgi:hypothetical protein